MGLQWAAKKIYPDIPAPVATNSVPTVATRIAPGATNAGAVVNIPVLTATAGPPPTLLTASEQTLSIGNDRLRAIITSRGGGLQVVELKDYPARIPLNRRERSKPNELANLNKDSFLPAFTYANAPALTEDGHFNLRAINNGVVAEKTLTNGLRLVRQFTIASNYILHVTERIENASSQPLTVPAQELVIGTASPMDPHEKQDSTGVYWFNGEDVKHIDTMWFANRTLGCIPGTARTEYVDGTTNVAWAAVHNRFFTLIAVPEQPAAKVISRNYLLPAPTKSQLEADGKLNPHPEAYQTALAYPEMTLAAAGVLERKFSVYAGPKEYFGLSQLAPRLDLVMDFTGITGFFAQALLLTLNLVHKLIPSYGWAIVGLTIFIKLLFWPLTAISTRSMKKMQALQPELQALKERYKDDQQKFAHKQLELFKKNGVNPAAGCLPMLIQFPVFIGFFFMLRTAIELRGETFLWVNDLSQPDTIFTIPGLGFIPLFGVAGVGLPINLLPLLMCASSLWMSSLTPVSPQMDPVQQKMMKYMPVFFVVFLYDYSSGLTLYWTVQNLLSVLQTKLTKMNEAKESAPPKTLAKRH
jgi:YidC/Oxa1 family membrane protein insertase